MTYEDNLNRIVLLLPKLSQKLLNLTPKNFFNVLYYILKFQTGTMNVVFAQNWDWRYLRVNEKCPEQTENRSSLL